MNSSPSAYPGELDFVSHSVYHLPDIPRFSTPSSISHAVTQAFRSSQMAPAPRPEHRPKQSVTIPQRPRWSRWFGRQPTEESSFSINSSFSARESPLTNVEPIDHGRHGRISLSSFPDPPLQYSNVNVYTSHLTSASQPTTPSEIHMHGGGNPRSPGPNSGVILSGTNSAPESPQIARPSSTYAQAFPRLPTSPTGQSAEYYEEVMSPGSRARVVSNSTSRQHRSMHAEISVLQLENQSLAQPSATCSAKFRASRQPCINPIVE
ncbi:hypothetical protein PtB15_12B465 [Puccinia triticina]|nr:hypothetical protein PtB15_12B465 [Puccinia triticina]